MTVPRPPQRGQQSALPLRTLRPGGSEAPVQAGQGQTSSVHPEPAVPSSAGHLLWSCPGISPPRPQGQRHPSRSPRARRAHEGAVGVGELPATAAPSPSRGLAPTGGSARPATSHLATARPPRAAAPRPSPAQSSLTRRRTVTSLPVSPPGPGPLQGGRTEKPKGRGGCERGQGSRVCTQGAGPERGAGL